MTDTGTQRLQVQLQTQEMTVAASKSRFTVAKLDAGMAILLTSDHHLIEFPSLLLPADIAAGSIIDLAVSQNKTEEEAERQQFTKLQDEIREAFGKHAPSTPELSVRNTTQTSVVLAWNLLDLATAEMRSMSLYKNGSKLGKIPNASTTTTKLSGLALDTEYTFQLVLRTSAGTFKSKPLQVKTHKMTNLAGLNVCIGHVRPEALQSLTAALERVGARKPHDRVCIETTHFVTDRGQGDEFIKAQQLNIPVVVPDFVEACEQEGRLIRVGDYYLDSDPSKRQKRTPTASSTTAAAASASAPSNAASAASGATSGQEALKKDGPSSAPSTADTSTSTSTPVVEQVKETVQQATEQVKALALDAQEGIAEGASKLAQAVGLKSSPEAAAETAETKSEGQDRMEEVVLSPAEAAPAEEEHEAEDEQAPEAETDAVAPAPTLTSAEKGKGKATDQDAEVFPPSMNREPEGKESEFESVSLS